MNIYYMGFPYNRGLNQFWVCYKKHQFLNQITFIALLYQDYHMAFVSIVDHCMICRQCYPSIVFHYLVWGYQIRKRE